MICSIKKLAKTWCFCNAEKLPKCKTIAWYCLCCLYGRVRSEIGAEFCREKCENAFLSAQVGGFLLATRVNTTPIEQDDCKVSMLRYAFTENAEKSHRREPIAGTVATKEEEPQISLEQLSKIRAQQIDLKYIQAVSVGGHAI